MSLRIAATCALGLEEILESELEGLGVTNLAKQRGAVTFSGSWPDVWRANLRLRTANRVTVELASWDGSSGDNLAKGAEKLVASHHAWDGVSVEELFHPRHSFLIRATTSGSKVRDTRWVGLKIKDGIVDAQRRLFGSRSSIDKTEPDLHLRVWLYRDRASLLLDTTGEPLDRRGYRVVTSAAPVREHLAAACVLASGWDGSGPVVDPMCGSGTLLAEAASFALGLAPGRLRKRWAFELLPGFDNAAWREIRSEAIPAPASQVELYGVDSARQAIDASRSNLARAGFRTSARLKVGDAFRFSPPAGPGLFLVNPAYGERLAEEGDQWPRLGDLLKQRYKGWKAVVLAGGKSLGKHIGLKPTRRIPVRNGPLEARILPFDLY